MRVGKRVKGLALLMAFLVTVVVMGTASLTGGCEEVSAAAGVVTLSTATIAGTNVVVIGKADSVISSDDGMYYLIAQNFSEAGAAGTNVAKVAAGTAVQFTFALGNNTANSNLYKRFVVAVKRGGVLTPVSNTRCITNPEAVAAHTAARHDGGKKGILPAASMIDTNDLTNLGVNQITYNLPVGDLCSSGGGSIPFTYNGKTYSFNAAIVGQYDSLVPKMNARGIQISMVVLNNLKSDTTLIHPLSRGHSGANYYAFNTAETAGIEKLEAVAAFLGQRYSGTGHGTIDNWIIGNEINARYEWNYMSNVDVNTYADYYADAFRIFYNGIKSQNANARIYISIDQQWSKSSDSNKYYGSVEFLNAFNAIVTAEGNIDWHVGFHPYNVPLYQPMAWAQSSLVTHSQDTRYVSMQNIDVLTDFLCQSTFLAPNGQVRSIICSEVGYTSSSGEAVQAASVTYGYLQAMANQHIDGFILSRELDDKSEIAQGLSLGLIKTNGTHKQAYEYYRNINGANAATYMAAAASTIGITDMATILTVR